MVCNLKGIGNIQDRYGQQSWYGTTQSQSGWKHNEITMLCVQICAQIPTVYCIDLMSFMILSITPALKDSLGSIKREKDHSHSWVCISAWY